MFIKAASVRERLRLTALVLSRFPLMARTDLMYDKWVISAGVCCGPHAFKV
jgi:hypothetical protein